MFIHVISRSNYILYYFWLHKKPVSATGQIVIFLRATFKHCTVICCWKWLFLITSLIPRNFTISLRASWKTSLSAEEAKSLHVMNCHGDYKLLCKTHENRSLTRSCSNQSRVKRVTWVQILGNLSEIGFVWRAPFFHIA